MSKKKKYALRVPLSVKGGIRAQQTINGPQRAWWNRRWTEMLEHFRLGARLGRGRNYAVTGQVSELAISAGHVTATVQGSNAEPYTSEIRFRTVPAEQKAQLVQTLRLRPMLIARLLIADLPLETETFFRQADCPLFPQRANDLYSHCTCPDYANPCKHLAAVYYLLGEAITRNPLLLLELRGIRRAELLGDAAEPPPPENFSEWTAASDVSTDADDYYGSAQGPLTADYGSSPHSATHAPLIYRLGPLPFWRGQERFVDTLEHLYNRAASRGWTVWAGEPLDLRREDEKVIIKGATLQLKGRKMRVDTTWS